MQTPASQRFISTTDTAHTVQRNGVRNRGVECVTLTHPEAAVLNMFFKKRTKKKKKERRKKDGDFRVDADLNLTMTTFNKFGYHHVHQYGACNCKSTAKLRTCVQQTYWHTQTTHKSLLITQTR